MKCPKCGYHSFDHLDSCKKCSHDLIAHKEKFNLRGFFSPGQPAASPEPVADVSDDTTDEPGDDAVDFGFDFLEEDDQIGGSTKSTSLDSAAQGISIDQPFGADSETIPADSLDFDDDDDKPGKGPEFAF